MTDIFYFVEAANALPILCLLCLYLYPSHGVNLHLNSIKSTVLHLNIMEIANEQTLRWYLIKKNQEHLVLLYELNISRFVDSFAYYITCHIKQFYCKLPYSKMECAFRWITCGCFSSLTNLMQTLLHLLGHNCVLYIQIEFHFWNSSNPCQMK